MNQDGNIPSLAAAYAAYFPIGAAVSPEVIRSHRDVLTRHFSSVTAENHMKFALVHPEPDRYDFAAADDIVAFAQANHMKVRGHTLVWHNQTPSWVFEGSDGSPVKPADLRARMREHIHTVMSRYRGRVYCWDVVNEAVADSGEAWLRDSKWHAILGPDYLRDAYIFAHEADPDALLFYNDYNECEEEKREKIYRLVRDLRAQDVPVHGIGMQGHWGLVRPAADDIRRTIERFASLGVQIQITELDITLYDWQDRRTDLRTPPPEWLERQAERYGEIFAIFREYKDVITGVTLWGVADDWTWRDDFPVRGRKDWPLLFDTAHQPKAAFWRALP
ncbi:beta-xylanase [Alicyclobacillus cellulosilyticus]|uniref:Beta-xylanase n=1 Tax=Alicyclobacillus cellulosilyticus TaxID=1003997 RepID=A0A917K2B4_9BACL|nr:endo-1,4-beta-xylanase [Alicyclobacillus cellulosilyticus]GGI98447.1 beta-xylanase [Alicyclobacillus cellulosilyticus]